jgi:cellulose synthase/poly-beta-1,6-N-acetylglucosamine synthase-like glycosyltransferase
MAALTLLWWVAFLFLFLQLITLLSNLYFFPVLSGINKNALNKNDSTPLFTEHEGTISILVPARNEARNLPTTLARLLEQNVLEIIVLDDESTDGTSEILEGFAKQYPQLKILKGQALPSGWSGKNWACHQLSEAAQGHTLIFTDADVRWEKETVASLIEFQHNHHADFVSVWPRQIIVSWLERVTVPLIDQILLCALPYLAVRGTPFAAFAAGNGQLMMWKRDAYNKVGGHAAFRHEVLEDVRMAQQAKGVGLKIALALGGNVIATRMYQTDQELIQGFSKNILAAAGSSRIVLLILLLLNTLAHSAAWIIAIWQPQWWLIILLSLSLRAITNIKTGRNWLELIWQPLIVFPLWRIGFTALLKRGSYQWKNRDYSTQGDSR